MSEIRDGRSGTPRRRRLRKAMAAGAAVAVGFVSTVVLAEWLANGTGEGYARAVEAQALTTESASASGDLYPGGTGDLVLRIRNPNPFPVTVTSVAQAGEITSDALGCDASNHGVTFTPPTTISLAVPASSSATHALGGAVAMASTSADACQGALFTIPVSLNGGAGGGSDPDPTCDDGVDYTQDFVDPASGECVHVEAATSIYDIVDGAVGVGEEVLVDDVQVQSTEAGSFVVGAFEGPNYEGPATMIVTISSGAAAPAVGDVLDRMIGTVTATGAEAAMSASTWSVRSGAPADGTPCDDGEPATVGDAYHDGVCVGGPPITCDDGNPYTADAFDPSTGTCTSESLDGHACDDGDPTNDPDVVQDGYCVGTGTSGA